MEKIKEVVEEEVKAEITEDEVKNEAEEDAIKKEPDDTEDKPAFLKEDEEDDKVPLPTFLKTKKKLKGQLSERDSEIEKLRSELESLKGTIGNRVQEQPVKRPRINDFDTDEEYEAAMDRYEDTRFNNISQNLSNANTQKTRQEQIIKKIEASVENHYSRAEELISQHGIDPETYRTADSNVRHAVEAVRPQQGNQSVDYLIAQLGEGSERVMFYLGRNKSKLAEFQSTLIDDPNGIKTAVFLGELNKELKNNTTKTSRSHKPAPSANGDAVPSSKGLAEKAKYDKAHAAGRVQEAYSIKKNAKQMGVDVKDWR